MNSLYTISSNNLFSIVPVARESTSLLARSLVPAVCMVDGMRPLRGRPHSSHHLAVVALLLLLRQADRHWSQVFAPSLFQLHSQVDGGLEYLHDLLGHLGWNVESTPDVGECTQLQ